MCRAVEKRDDIHFEDVLAAGRHFFEDQLSQRDREFLNAPVVGFEQIEKLFRRFGHPVFLSFTGDARRVLHRSERLSADRHKKKDGNSFSSGPNGGASTTIPESR